MSQDYFAYIGTYTTTNSEGLYVYRLRMDSGVLEYVSKVTGLKNPTFLDTDPAFTNLYTVNEVLGADNEPVGAVSAFSIDENVGTLTYLNTEQTKSIGPCHLSVDSTGKVILVANYKGSGLTVFPIKPDGSIGESNQKIQHEGSSINPERQKEPHPHSTIIDLNNKYVFVPDLGVDKIFIYELDLATVKLIANDVSWARVEAGSGPRHFTFHPSGKYAYVINEMGSTITSFTYDETRGTLGELEMVSTLPPEFSGENYPADIHISPDGRFIYGSNRGHDSIAIFSINETNGKLGYVGHQSTLGSEPRNFALDPTGTFLLVANQDSDNIVTFLIDKRTGKLEPTGNVIEVPMPVCIKFVPVRT